MSAIDTAVRPSSAASAVSTDRHRSELTADDGVGDRAFGQGHDQPDRLVQQDRGDGRVVMPG
jgi:hypothetical protein